MVSDRNLQEKLEEKTRAIFKDNKGILAIDESPNSILKKFEKYNIENNIKNRTLFREMLINTPEIEKYISGVILHEETFFEKDLNGSPLVEIIRKKGIQVGIKLDKGLLDFEGNEKISLGIEDLETRILENNFKKADFAKWRSLFYVTDNTPSEKCINMNCEILTKYAKICQKNGLVPIIEPEVFYEGDYNIERAISVTKKILSTLFLYLNDENIYIPGIIIKMGFVTPGKSNSSQISVDEVGQYTKDVLISTIPIGLPGIVFLSGGHDDDSAVSYLNSTNKNLNKDKCNLSFSFGRTLTNKPLSLWKTDCSNNKESQQALKDIAKSCSIASIGKLND